MRVSILIATRDRAPLLERSLRALAASRVRPSEIIVVDQSDGDDSERVVERLAADCRELVYQRSARRGKSHAINEAFAVSSGDLLGLTDDDVLVDPGWVETALAVAAAHPDIDAFCGRVLPETGTSSDDYKNLVLSLEPRIVDGSVDPIHPAVCGADLYVRREAFAAIGMYDPHFGPGEVFRSNDDGELAYRLIRSGRRLRYSPELQVQHMGWRRETDNRALTFDYAYSLGGFAGYYLRQRDPRPALYLLKTWAFSGLRLAAGCVRVQGDEIADAYINVVGIGRGFVRGLGTPASAPGAAR